MRRKLVLVAFVVGLIGFGNEIQSDSLGQDLLGKSKKERRLAFKERMAARESKEGELDEDENSNLHDSAANCDLGFIMSTFFSNPMLKNKAGETARDIARRRFRDEKREKQCMNCYELLQILMAMESSYMAGYSDAMDRYSDEKEEKK